MTGRYGFCCISGHNFSKGGHDIQKIWFDQFFLVPPPIAVLARGEKLKRRFLRACKSCYRRIGTNKRMMRKWGTPRNLWESSVLQQNRGMSLEEVLAGYEHYGISRPPDLPFCGSKSPDRLEWNINLVKRTAACTGGSGCLNCAFAGKWGRILDESRERQIKKLREEREERCAREELARENLPRKERRRYRGILFQSRLQRLLKHRKERQRYGRRGSVEDSSSSLSSRSSSSSSSPLSSRSSSSSSAASRSSSTSSASSPSSSSFVSSFLPSSNAIPSRNDSQNVVSSEDSFESLLESVLESFEAEESSDIPSTSSVSTSSSSSPSPPISTPAETPVSVLQPPSFPLPSQQPSSSSVSPPVRRPPLPSSLNPTFSKSSVRQVESHAQSTPLPTPTTSHLRIEPFGASSYMPSGNSSVSFPGLVVSPFRVPKSSIRQCTNGNFWVQIPPVALAEKISLDRPAVRAHVLEQVKQKVRSLGDTMVRRVEIEREKLNADPDRFFPALNEEAYAAAASSLEETTDGQFVAELGNTLGYKTKFESNIFTDQVLCKTNPQFWNVAASATGMLFRTQGVSHRNQKIGNLSGLCVEASTSLNFAKNSGAGYLAEWQRVVKSYENLLIQLSFCADNFHFEDGGKRYFALDGFGRIYNLPKRLSYEQREQSLMVPAGYVACPHELSYDPAELLVSGQIHVPLSELLHFESPVPGGGHISHPGMSAKSLFPFPIVELSPDYAPDVMKFFMGTPVDMLARFSSLSQAELHEVMRRRLTSTMGDNAIVNHLRTGAVIAEWFCGLSRLEQAQVLRLIPPLDEEDETYAEECEGEVSSDEDENSEGPTLPARMEALLVDFEARMHFFRNLFVSCCKWHGTQAKMDAVLGIKHSQKPLWSQLMLKIFRLLHPGQETYAVGPKGFRFCQKFVMFVLLVDAWKDRQFREECYQQLLLRPKPGVDCSVAQNETLKFRLGAIPEEDEEQMSCSDDTEGAELEDLIASMMGRENDGSDGPPARVYVGGRVSVLLSLLENVAPQIVYALDFMQLAKSMKEYQAFLLREIQVDLQVSCDSYMTNTCLELHQLANLDQVQPEAAMRLVETVASRQAYAVERMHAVNESMRPRHLKGSNLTQRNRCLFLIQIMEEGLRMQEARYGVKSNETYSQSFDRHKEVLPKVKELILEAFREIGAAQKLDSEYSIFPFVRKGSLYFLKQKREGVVLSRVKKERLVAESAQMLTKPMLEKVHQRYWNVPKGAKYTNQSAICEVFRFYIQQIQTGLPFPGLSEELERVVRLGPRPLTKNLQKTQPSGVVQITDLELDELLKEDRFQQVLKTKTNERAPELLGLIRKFHSEIFRTICTSEDQLGRVRSLLRRLRQYARGKELPTPILREEGSFEPFRDSRLDPPPLPPMPDEFDFEIFETTPYRGRRSKKTDSPELQEPEETHDETRSPPPMLPSSSSSAPAPRRSRRIANPTKRPSSVPSSPLASAAAVPSPLSTPRRQMSPELSSRQKKKKKKGEEDSGSSQPTTARKLSFSPPSSSTRPMRTRSRTRAMAAKAEAEATDSEFARPKPRQPRPSDGTRSRPRKRKRQETDTNPRPRKKICFHSDITRLCLPYPHDSPQGRLHDHILRQILHPRSEEDVDAAWQLLPSIPLDRNSLKSLICLPGVDMEGLVRLAPRRQISSSTMADFVKHIPSEPTKTLIIVTQKAGKLLENPRRDRLSSEQCRKLEALLRAAKDNHERILSHRPRKEGDFLLVDDDWEPFDDGEVQIVNGFDDKDYHEEHLKECLRVLEYETVMVVVHLPRHWTLLRLTYRDRELAVRYYDSLGHPDRISRQHPSSVWSSTMDDFFSAVLNEQPTPARLRNVVTELEMDHGLQTANSNDCGLFVLGWILAHCLRFNPAKFLIGPEGLFRKFVFRVIIKQHLSEEMKQEFGQIFIAK